MKGLQLSRQISLKHETETDDCSCEALSADFFNISVCVPPQFPSIEIRLHLHMGNA